MAATYIGSLTRSVLRRTAESTFISATAGYEKQTMVRYRQPASMTAAS